MGIERCRFCHEEHDIYVSCRGVPVVQEIFPETIGWKARAAAWKACAKGWRDTAIFNRKERFRGFEMVSEEKSRAEKAEADAAAMRLLLEDIRKGSPIYLVDAINKALESNAGRDLLERLKKAEGDCAAYKERAATWKSISESAEDETALLCNAAIHKDAELEAAREVVKAARAWELDICTAPCGGCDSCQLREALAKYDAVVKR